MRSEDVVLIKKVAVTMEEMMKIVMEEEGVEGIEELHIAEEVDEVEGMMMKNLKMRVMIIILIIALVTTIIGEATKRRNLAN
jgi:hypothetical protein